MFNEGPGEFGIIKSIAEASSEGNASYVSKFMQRVEDFGDKYGSDNPGFMTYWNGVRSDLATNTNTGRDLLAALNEVEHASLNLQEV